MNALRFGAPDHPKTRHLVAGVVSGVGGYGNSFGVPTVGGEVNFDPRYNGNILVNAFAAGLAKTNAIFLSQAKGAGLLYKDTSPKFMSLFDIDTLRNLGANAPTGGYAYTRAPFSAISSQMRRCSRGWCCAVTFTPLASDSASISDLSTAWLSTSCGGTLLSR